MPKEPMKVEATEEEKIMLFKLAAQSADNMACDNILEGEYQKTFKLVFASRLNVISDAYFRFKEEYIHEV